jgi:hypothetical protein
MSETETPDIERTRVGFPEAQVEETRSFNYKALIIIVLILALIGGGVWYMFFRAPEEEIIDEPVSTPTVAEVISSPTPTVEAVNKADIKIQILNGSGVVGAAGKAQSALTAVGYTGIEVGNADSYTYKTTVVAFGDTVPEPVKQEITTELEKIYGKIDTKPNTSTKYNVVITIGYPKGFTPSVTSRPAATSATTPTSAPVSGSITPTRATTTTVTPTP